MPSPWIALTLAAVLGQAPLGPGTATPYRGAPAAADATEPATRTGGKPIYVGPRSGVQQSSVPQPQINAPRPAAADAFSAKPSGQIYSLPAASANRYPVQPPVNAGPAGRPGANAAETDPLARIREEAYRSEVARRQAERNQLQGLSSMPNPLQKRAATASTATIQTASATVASEQPRAADPHQARIRELQLRIEQQRQHLRALEESLQQELQLTGGAR